MVLGLVFGVGAVTWAFSGMLSMEPFPSPAGDGAVSSRRIAQMLRGEFQLTAFEAKHPADAIRQLGAASVKELELTAFAGKAAYLARLANDETRIVPIDGEPRIEFDREQITNVLQLAASSTGGADIHLVTEYDRYYLDRRGRRPLPVILAQFHDSGRTRYYIDPKTARIVGTYSGDWMNRWLYHGLHSLDFPWLYKHRPLWDVVVIIFMLGGTALSVTSVILACRVLSRKLANRSSLITDPESLILESSNPSSPHP